jgi:cation diffusion facilitator family transporter
MSRATRLASASLAIAVTVLALKGAAWWITGSVALLADAVESIVNVAASASALAAVLYSQRPADANHPYGHAKAEYFSAVLTGVLIVVAAISILREAWGALLNQRGRHRDQCRLGLGADPARPRARLARLARRRAAPAR